MSSNVDELGQDAAKKQQAFQDVVRRLTESGQRLFASSGSWSEAGSRAHTRLFEEFVETRKAMNRAIRLYHEKALEAAGVPQEHPLWAFVQKKK